MLERLGHNGIALSVVETSPRCVPPLGRLSSADSSTLRPALGHGGKLSRRDSAEAGSPDAGNIQVWKTEKTHTQKHDSILQPVEYAAAADVPQESPASSLVAPLKGPKPPTRPNSTPQTPNLKPQTPNLKPKILKPASQTLSPKPSTPFGGYT